MPSMLRAELPPIASSEPRRAGLVAASAAAGGGGSASIPARKVSSAAANSLRNTCDAPVRTEAIDASQRASASSGISLTPCPRRARSEL